MGGLVIAFAIDGYTRWRLLSGFDDIDLTPTRLSVMDVGNASWSSGKYSLVAGHLGCGEGNLAVGQTHLEYHLCHLVSSKSRIDYWYWQS